MEVEKKKYPKVEFLENRLDALNAHAKRAFLLQQFGSVTAFAFVLVGVSLVYTGRVELALVQWVSSIATSLVTYLFYRQSNKANDDVNKFALISIKFNEAWNIVQQAMKHCGYITNETGRDEVVRSIIDKQLELALSEKVWELALDLQKVLGIEEKTIEEQPVQSS